MKLEEFFRDMIRLLDETMRVINKTIDESTGEKKELYLDYRKNIRDMGVLLYQLIGKMRMDRVFDPETSEGLLLLISKPLGETRIKE